jgi:DNA polymerase-3 subunit epsilon
LLDAELLADVYINMTRGQDALLIDMETVETQGGVIERLDLSQFDLPIVSASEQECLAHLEVMTQIDKASGGKTVWRALENPVA